MCVYHETDLVLCATDCVVVIAVPILWVGLKKPAPEALHIHGHVQQNDWR
jgi:hypothetical protein